MGKNLKKNIFFIFSKVLSKVFLPELVILIRFSLELHPAFLIHQSPTKIQDEGENCLLRNLFWMKSLFIRRMWIYFDCLITVGPSDVKTLSSVWPK